MSTHRQRILSGFGGDKVVDVNTVITKLPFLSISIASDFHFLTWHSKFESVEYLLRYDATLYYIDSSKMVFLEHEPGVNIYNTKNYPFFFIAQRSTAIRVLIVPLNQLHILSQKIRDPECNVAWICHMSRCGSTTVVQGITAIPNCAAISENQDMLVHLATVSSSRRIDISE